MFKVDDNSLKQYPALQRYVAATHDFDNLLSNENYDAIYVLDVLGDFKNAKKRDFCLLEICVMMGLERHIDDIKAHTDILQQLERRQYRAFRLAIATLHLDIADKLVSFYPGNPKHMIRPFNFRVLKYAVQIGSKEAVLKLIQFAGDERDKMFASHGYQAINIAFEKGQKEMIACLLSYPANFMHATKHKKYHPLILHFIDDFLNGLVLKKNKEKEGLALAISMVAFILDIQKEPIFQEISHDYLTRLMSYPGVRDALQSKS